MSAIADRYRRLAAAFTEKVAAVPADRWSSPSPCEGCSAHDVFRHVVETQGMFLGSVGRELGPIPSVDDDAVAAWQAASAVVQADLDDPERAAAGYDGFFGPTTFQETVDRFGCLDLVVHGWDLARAAGLDDRIDPEEVRRVTADTASFGDALRSPGVCEPAVEPGTRLLPRERGRQAARMPAVGCTAWHSGWSSAAAAWSASRGRSACWRAWPTHSAGTLRRRTWSSGRPPAR